MLHTFLRHNEHKLLRYGLPLGGLAFVIGGFVLLNSSILFTYRSRANEEVFNTIEKQQHSIATVQVHDDLPLCVSALSYVPIADKSLQSCFVQFQCIDPTDIEFFSSPHYSCTTQNQIYTCSENESPEGCAYIDEWIKGVAITCGCEDEVEL